MNINEKIDLIINSSHSDPFEVLGAHPVTIDNKNAVAIRAFLPDAKEVYVIEMSAAKKEDLQLFHLEDILDWGKFIEKLKKHERPFEKRMWNSFYLKTKELISKGVPNATKDVWLGCLSCYRNI